MTNEIQLMYDVSRAMRRGFRYGQMASPIINEDEQEEMINKMRRFHQSVEQNKLKFAPKALKNSQEK